MKSFEEYWNDQKKNGFVPTFRDVASNAFKAGQQSKQAEVDELRKRLTMYEREGYKLVPIKCTNNMAHAAKEIDGRLSAFKYGDVWEAMIGACDDH